MEKTSVRIPFSGFYPSESAIAAVEVDEIAKMPFTDDHGDVHALYDDAIYLMNWNDAYRVAAVWYVEAFAEHFKIPGAEFDLVTHPRAYNFETDRVFAMIPLDVMARMAAAVWDTELVEHARRAFTSRDGFISHYSPDPDTWGPMADWDHNQHGVVLDAWLESKFGPDAAYEFEIDAFAYNFREAKWADVEAALYGDDNPRLTRLADIAYYLRERAARAA